MVVVRSTVGGIEILARLSAKWVWFEHGQTLQLSAGTDPARPRSEGS
jgi:hypothetical protein